MATRKKSTTTNDVENTTLRPLGKNQLFYGDNLDVLRRKIPSESVDLCYIDPPFNSKRNYFQIYNNIGTDGGDKAQAQAFMDTWEWGDEAEAGFAFVVDVQNLNNGKFTPQTVALIKGLELVLGHGDLFAYLVHMTLRIVEIHRVLKSTGSFYLHCDPTASHYLKLILDSVFCADGNGGDFLNEIVWKRKTGRGETNHKSMKYGVSTDTIFFYTKTASKNTFHSQFNHNADGYQKYVADFFKHTDENGRRYAIDNLASPSDRPNLKYEYKGFNPPSKGWAISLELMQQWDAEGRLHFPSTATGRIRRKRYADELKGRPVQNLWDDIDAISSQAAERLGYPTQKPESLLERIIQASSNEGDTVLDAYCGCGTTVAVAQRLGRRWIGIDITYQSISLILKRLQDKYPKQWINIEENIQLDGVPRDYESAKALANRKDDKTRKEFEKWAILTYSKNQARINDKKGADGGIDGEAFFMLNANTNGKAVFQVKSGGATRATIATLNSDRQREKAEFGILITMDNPTASMLKEVQAAGKYKHPMLNRDDDRIQIVTIQELLDGKRLNLPMSRNDAVKSAEAVGDADKQQNLLPI